jgi:tetratricopeptide (TPR) repeat protein
LGEFDNAIQTLLQALEYFPNEYEIEYRLAGLYFMTQQIEKGKYHLTNGLHLNANHYTLIEEIFPTIWKLKTVQQIIQKHLKTL